MNYSTYKPSESISHFVKCYWTLDANEEKPPQKQRIIPDGCMEMIFHYGDLFKQYAQNGEPIIQPTCFVFGQITEPLDIEPTGKTGIFAVRFFPDGFVPFATVPIQAMENRAVSLPDLFGHDGLQLANQVLSASTVEDRITQVEAFLLQRLLLAESIQKVVQTSIEALLTENGQLSVDDLATQLGVNRRKLERKFATTIGLSPKQLFKIIRLQAALKMLVNKEATNLTTIAIEGEYYDQSHFNKDFKEFTGVSPKQFYANNLKMASLFSSNE
jgi:AraC-like DNA-binding protein